MGVKMRMPKGSSCKDCNIDLSDKRGVLDCGAWGKTEEDAKRLLVTCKHTKFAVFCTPCYDKMCKKNDEYVEYLQKIIEKEKRENEGWYIYLMNGREVAVRQLKPTDELHKCSDCGQDAKSIIKELWGNDNTTWYWCGVCAIG